MKIFIVMLVQKIFGLFGLHVRKLSKEVNLDNAFEEQLRLVDDEIRCIIEVGAADGRDTLSYAQRNPNSKVYAYEPLPESFGKLKDKQSSVDNIIAVNNAVSDKSGTANFHVTALEDASSLLEPKKTGSTFDKYTEPTSNIDVRVTTLDEECVKRNIGTIDILKMDAQGAELRILKGTRQLLEKKSIDVIYSEVNFMEIYEGCCLYHQVASFLEEYGYHLHSLYDLKHNQQGQLAWGDAIFKRGA